MTTLDVVRKKMPKLPAEETAVKELVRLAREQSLSLTMQQRMDSMPTPRCLGTTAAAAVSQAHSPWWPLTSRTTLALQLFTDPVRHGALYQAAAARALHQ